MMFKQVMTACLALLLVFGSGVGGVFVPAAGASASSGAAAAAGVKPGGLPPIPALPDLSTFPEVVLKPPSPPATNAEETPIKPMVTTPSLPGGSYDRMNIRLKVNGKEIIHKPIYFANSSLLIPVRPVAESMGVAVEWRPPGGVLIRKGETTIALVIGSATGQKNGETFFMEQPPVIDRGTTMVPVRFIAEVMAASVAWDTDIGFVTIVSDGDFEKDRQPIGEYSPAPDKKRNRFTDPDAGPASEEAKGYVLEQGILQDVTDVQYTPSYLYEYQGYDTMVVGTDEEDRQQAVWLTGGADSSRIKVVASALLESGLSREAILSILSVRGVDRSTVGKLYLIPVRDRVCWFAVTGKQSYYLDFYTGKSLMEDIDSGMPVVSSAPAKNTPPGPSASPEKEAALRGEYFDFAIKYRLDYVPFFSEGNAPADSTEYLYYAFAINLDSWGDDKGVMRREYVDQVIHSHFIAGEINHKSLPRGWNYDGQKYTAVPAGIKDKPVYALQGLKSSTENGRTVYDAVLGYYNPSNGSVPSDEDMKRIRGNVVAGDLSELTLLQTEEVRYTIDGTTGEPVFLSHALGNGGLPEESAAPAIKPDPVYDPAAYLSDAEIVTAGGVRLAMAYDKVLAIVGKPDESYDNAPGVKSFTKDGYHYGFYQIDEHFPEDYPLPHDNNYYLLQITATENCKEPLPRGIRIGDGIDDVFDKFPTEDRVLKEWAEQAVYGRQEIGQPRAFLEYTTVLGTYRICATTTTQTLNICFDQNNRVRSVELSFEKG